jgi:uncharacterized protein
VTRDSVQGRSNATALALAAVAGALFGVGLLISGMTQPAKVIGFLDVTRDWDPSLAFVMGGAVAVNSILFRVVRRRTGPWFEAKFYLPTRRDSGLSLVAGAALFGIGWGLGGLCPGPGLVSSASGDVPALAFTGAMIVGMLIQHRSARK